MSNTKHVRACAFACVFGALALGLGLGLAKAQGSDQQPSFPDVKTSYLKTGEFIAPDRPSRVRVGLSKDQVRLQLGNPHFAEGIAGVSQWDYAFNFYGGKGTEHVTCQMQVRFDKTDGDYRVAATNWNSADCAARALASASPNGVPALPTNGGSR
ncbi:MAG: outer membrane protein assembly factor BamE [Proteobacteria bacterium]|nr:outer membrane protein assembly factor BamE [Pseudomonadota bacterium]